MLGNFFHSFYYGKAGKSDFNPENLPENRVQLFFDMLRVRWGSLVKLNLLYILFWLPALLWTGWNLLAVNSIASMQQAGEILESQMGEQLLGIVWLWLLILAPCIAITGPATAGVSYVTRNWARDQHSFMFSDFKDAFRENWKQALIVSTITGILPPVIFVCYRFYGEMAGSNGLFFIVPQMLVLVLALVWMLSLQILYTLMITYKLNLRHLLRNAMILAVGKLPLSVGIRLLSLVIPAIILAVMWFIPSVSMYGVLVLLLYIVLFGFSFNRFLYASFANAICEKYINSRIDGAPVGMGLRQTTDADYEIDPTLPQPGAAEPKEDTQSL